ncbi:MAG: hypothetical protein A2498_04540 [Lentisphaerae bacterium RIFOXYC12_FULL_60_16]|nr:MAG: hypothetical protein A2498_04540 [Lentisphaerae bacterium RIFOXYC12_FULL_60_16]OGV74266.1 MAG: hypothetical protein A2269_00495 [Lentisphaerae bacterium RIFOXYA12_FULL_60_10]
MALFGKSRDRTTAPSADELQALIDVFEDQIRTQENLLYGAALFFEAISILHEGHDAIIETYRKQLRNVIHTGRDNIQRAAALLGEVRADPSGAALLRQFTFNPFQGHPDPAGMQKRAQLFLETYKRIFPSRPRDREFTPEETLQLVDATARRYQELETA